MFAYKKINFCILLILCSIKYISIEELYYTVLFFKSLKVLDFLYKISAKYRFSKLFPKINVFKVFSKSMGLIRMALIVSRPSFGLKFRRFGYCRLGCGSPII